MASIKKRGNTYQIRVSNGRDPEGKQIFKTVTFTPDPAKTDKQNQKDLEYFAADFERAVRSGFCFDGDKLTFKEFAELHWRPKYGLIRIEPNTLETYDQLLRDHIFPAIGSMKMKQIKSGHLNDLYVHLSQERKDGKPGGYPASTIRRVSGVIGSVFTFAYKNDVVPESPCKKATLPKDVGEVDESVKTFTAAQTTAFLEFMNQPFTVTRHPRNRAEYTQIQTVPEQIQIFLTMAILCGCRRSEHIALKWSDVDFEHKIIRIHKAAVLAKGELIIKSTKTARSFRTISLPDPLVEDLRRYHQHQLEYRLKIGSKWEGEDYIFIQWNGRQMRPETPRKAFKRILQRYNDTHQDDPLPDITLHDLRHTNATLLISENTDIRTVSGRLGHSRTSTTLDIYAEALKEKDRAAADALTALLYKRS